MLDRAKARMSGDSGDNSPIVVAVAGQIGEILARRLDSDHRVVYLGEDGSTVDRLREAGVDAREIDVTDGTALRNTNIAPGVAVVGAGRDQVSLLTAQLLRTVLDVEDVVVKVNDPGNADSFADLGFETVRVSDLLADGILDAIPSGRS